MPSCWACIQVGHCALKMIPASLDFPGHYIGSRSSDAFSTLRVILKPRRLLGLRRRACLFQALDLVRSRSESPITEVRSCVRCESPMAGVASRSESPITGLGSCVGSESPKAGGPQNTETSVFRHSPKKIAQEGQGLGRPIQLPGHFFFYWKF